IPRVAPESVLALSPLEHIVAVPAGNQVIAGVPLDAVMPVPTRDRVIPQPGVNRIIPLAAADIGREVQASVAAAVLNEVMPPASADVNARDVSKSVPSLGAIE